MPNRRLRWFSFHTFYHESRSSTYVANGGKTRIGYGPGPVPKETVSIESVSITDYTIAEMTNVSGLEISFSLGRDHVTRSAAWLVFHFHPFCEQSSTPGVGLVQAGAEPAFAFCLEGQVHEKWAISDVNSALYTGSSALASQQVPFSVIDTMLFR